MAHCGLSGHLSLAVILYLYHLGGGWTIMTVNDFTLYKKEFIASYNKLKGVKTLKLFQSGNCCFAVKVAPPPPTPTPLRFHQIKILFH